MGKRNHRGKKNGVKGGPKQYGKGTKDDPILIRKSNEPITDATKKCPMCGGSVMVTKGQEGLKVSAKTAAEIWRNLPPEKPEILARLRELRGDKKTVCFLGTSPDNCNLAPWGDPVDMWGVNDAHRLEYMEDKWNYITGWFQMHHRWRWMLMKEIPGSERLRYGQQHYDFLTATDLKFPIYMQKHYEGIPRSVEFPIRDITESLLYKKIQRGYFWQRKYYTCSFAYMASLAIWSRTPEGQKFFGHSGFERAELYGVQLAQQIEYMQQKPSTEFWIGMMIASGMEVYVPNNGLLLSGECYGYRNPHGNPSLGQIDEDNIGYWDWEDGVPDYGFRDKITWG